ncbi:hypothetical protein HZY91_04400 [Facklamia sp. DSM 111018]|uniref:HpcH/HpaI aldolase/citrate lyase domain-containing protein n=1 Tax=Facklamia lactis TaxID=2749967 RepID=A0ABS0LPR1_9LACT|nr:aldolase/citrate lyase family protein [Facklamia lactis]MBG9986133.1 hypothetical protein [Facklamia lactis]
MKNRLKEKLLNGEKVFGTFHGIGNASLVEIIGYTGFNFVLLDTEHGPYDVVAAQEYIRAAKVAKVTPLVRVKDSQRNSLLKMLDVGACGVIIPNVKTKAEVEAIILDSKYAPIGKRGFGPNSGNSFLTGEFSGKNLNQIFEIHNDETLVIPQCETKECLDQIEEIVALKGVDGIFVGPYDLSVALGCLGETNSPLLIKAMERVIDACKRQEKFSFIYCQTLEEVKQRIDMGYNAITYSMDSLIFVEACEKMLKTMRGFTRNRERE